VKRSIINKTRDEKNCTLVMNVKIELKIESLDQLKTIREMAERNTTLREGLLSAYPGMDFDTLMRKMEREVTGSAERLRSGRRALAGMRREKVR
jgi:hypothetical protein